MKQFKFLTLLLSIGCLLITFKVAQAVTFQSIVNITAKDANYQTLTNINFNIYKQTTNVDGKKFPGDSVASGVIKESGIAQVKITFDTSKPVHIIKFYTKNANVAPIYYYDVDLTNAYAYNLIARLSSLRLTLKDAEGNLLPGQKFNLYVQKGISGGTYLKGETYATGLTMGVSGYYETFLGEGAYLMEIPLSNNLILQKGDIKVTKEQRIMVNYALSEILVTVKDENGVVTPKQKFSIYEQTNNTAGDPALGKLVLSSDTDTSGTRKLFLPPATYAIKFSLANNQSEILFNKILAESSLLDITYSTSGLKLILKDVNDNCVKNKNVEVFIQKCATCGVIAGNRVASGKTNESGEIIFKLSPGTYVVKISGANGFDYYLYDQTINPGETKIITEHLSLIRVISKKSSSEVLKNARVTISSQKLDINKKPLADKTIATLDTKDTGQADYYLPAGYYVATFNKNQIAALEIKRGYMTRLSIIDQGNAFNYPIEMISLGPIDSGTPAKPKITVSFYSKERLKSLAQEQNLARQLKDELEKIVGKGRIGLARAYWSIFVNAYIYGEYTPAEISDTIKNGPQAVHPEIPAASWRDSADYQKYLARIK
ncbi:MAG: hypothetical protein V1892_00225 [bacterium]